jgi:hypothetical protein
MAIREGVIAVTPRLQQLRDLVKPACPDGHVDTSDHGSQLQRAHAVQADIIHSRAISAVSHMLTNDGRR